MEDGVVDRAQFLTAGRVPALVGATPLPYNVLVHLAPWTGLGAVELAGLQIGVWSCRPRTSPTLPARLNVHRTVLVKF